MQWRQLYYGLKGTGGYNNWSFSVKKKYMVGLKTTKGASMLTNVIDTYYICISDEDNSHKLAVIVFEEGRY